MQKIIVVSLAILAISTSGAVAKKAMKPKPPGASAGMNTGAPPMMGQPSAADRALYMKNQHDSGMAKKKK